jgi:hypothetical protein
MPAVGCHLVKINLLHAKNVYNLKLVKISSLLPPVRRRPVLVLFVDSVWLFILVHCCTPVYLYVVLVNLWCPVGRPCGITNRYTGA